MVPVQFIEEVLSRILLEVNKRIQDQLELRMSRER